MLIKEGPWVYLTTPGLLITRLCWMSSNLIPRETISYQWTLQRWFYPIRILLIGEVLQIIIQFLRILNKIQHKLEVRAKLNPERNYSNATTATGSHDERKVSIYLRALDEVSKSNPEWSNLFTYIHEHLDALFNSLLNKKTEENDYMTKKIEICKKQIIEERKNKEIANKLYKNL